jgi:transcription initiation factor TFIIH subunit 3
VVPAGRAAALATHEMKRSRGASNRPSLVTVVLDVDESAWSETATTTSTDAGAGSAGEALSLGGALKSLLVFMNAVRLLNRENEVALVAQCPDGTARFWADSTSRDVGKGRALGACLQSGLQALVGEQRAAKPGSGAGSAGSVASLAAALSRALCHANRVISEHERRFGQAPLARMLVVQARADDASQYIPVMNAAFAAQKKGIVVDVMDLSLRRSTTLQQVAHLTGGILQHYTALSHGEFTQLLLSVFLGDVEDRKLLRQPPQAPIVLEAACFCHGELKARGWVCSVCLSVFCKDPATDKPPRATCPTCKTRIAI